MSESIRYIVRYSAYRYSCGPGTSGDFSEEVKVKSEAAAIKLAARINKSAQVYKDQCNGSHDDEPDDLPDEETERWLNDSLIGYEGGFFHAGAKAYVEHVRREELLTAPDEGKDAA